MISFRWLPVLVFAAACGAGGADSPGIDAPDDAPDGCHTGISYEVTPPFASPSTFVRVASSITNSPGQHTFDWAVIFNGVTPLAFEMAEPNDFSAIKFNATQAGNYTVRYRIEDPLCLEASTVVEVKPPGVGTSVLRVHVVAPPDEGRPPVDKQVLVEGGATDLIDDIQLEPGVIASGVVALDGSPVSAYLKFMPSVGSDAIVETYSDLAGNYSAEVRGESHSVLVIPTSTTTSPQIVSWTPGQTTLALAQGVPVGGTVLDSASTPVQNAAVQVTVDGVPSTIGFTDNAGTWSVFAPQASGNVRVEVTPPPSSGLPRLVAEDPAFTVGTGMAIQYAATTIRDLDTTNVQRGGNSLTGATVTIVGSIPSAGTVTLGQSLTAVGEVRATAITDGTGDLPTLRVPAAQLHAVIFPAGGTGDHALTAINLTNTVPATIAAQAMTSKPTQLVSSTGTPLPGAILDAVPIAKLALAGAPTIRRVAGANGNLTIDLAPTAEYDLRLTDPNGNRGALAVIPGQTTVTFANPAALTKATKVTATVKGTNAIPGAVVQFLCADCTGLERSRPIGEGVTGIDGKFTIAVPDNN